MSIKLEHELRSAQLSLLLMIAIISIGPACQTATAQTPTEELVAIANAMKPKDTGRIKSLIDCIKPLICSGNKHIKLFVYS